MGGCVSNPIAVQERESRGATTTEPAPPEPPTKVNGEIAQDDTTDGINTTAPTSTHSGMDTSTEPGEKEIVEEIPNFMLLEEPIFTTSGPISPRDDLLDPILDEVKVPRKISNSSDSHISETSPLRFEESSSSEKEVEGISKKTLPPLRGPRPQEDLDFLLSAAKSSPSSPKRPQLERAQTEITIAQQKQPSLVRGLSTITTKDLDLMSKILSDVSSPVRGNL